MTSHRPLPEWVGVPGLESFYDVNRQGMVRTKTRVVHRGYDPAEGRHRTRVVRVRILRPLWSTSGQCIKYTLSAGGHRFERRRDRLVMDVFGMQPLPWFPADDLRYSKT